MINLFVELMYDRFTEINFAEKLNWKVQWQSEN